MLQSVTEYYQRNSICWAHGMTARSMGSSNPGCSMAESLLGVHTHQLSDDN